MYQFFGNKKFGTKEEALKAAEMYRDNVVIPWKNEKVRNEEKELNESILKRMIYNAISNGNIDMVINFVNEAKLIYL